MRGGVDNGQIHARRVRLAQQAAELPGIRSYRIEFAVLRAALAPAVGAVLRVNIENAVLSVASAAQTAMCTASVVFPLPPFWEIIANVLTTTTPPKKVRPCNRVAWLRSSCV